jgi:hypothetical protein
VLCCCRIVDTGLAEITHFTAREKDVLRLYSPGKVE